MADEFGAFAGVDGYGSETVGGRGGAIVHVTNLNDSGIGSLRWALESLSGARTVVFDVAGTISLKQQILIENGNVTIAGQTAPGEGITLEGARVRVKASEVIVRGLHFRPGDGAEGQTPGDRDGIMVGTTDFDIHNVVIDHNSFSWAIDENIDINGRVHDMTVSNNIIAEGLSNSIHPKGEHSKGLALSNWDGAEGDASRITIVGNLFSDNVQRNPEVRAGQDIEIVNNYIYNYGLAHIGTAIGGADNGTVNVSVDIVGNVYDSGPSTPGRAGAKAPIYLNKMGANSTVALADNLYLDRVVDATGDQDQSLTYWSPYTTKPVLGAVVDLGSGVSVIDSTQVGSYVLSNAGAVNGSGHDAIDQRIIAEVVNGSGQIINKVSQVYDGANKGVITLANTDTDRDGMVDWFEDLYGFDKRVADQNGDNDKDGYTNLEEYINGIITGFDLGATKVAPVKTSAVKGAALTSTVLSTPAALIGFLAGGGEAIDLSAVVKQFDTSKQALGDFVEIGYAGGNSYISVDTDGPGGSSIKTLVAVIEKAHVALSDLVVHSASQLPVDPGQQNGGGTIVVAPTPVYDPHVYFGGTAGNDTFSIKTDMDRVVERDEGGYDLVVSYVSDYTLDANVESLSIKTGLNGTGNELDNKIAGNDLANILSGMDGADLLRAAGGNDTLYGGDGDDRLEGNDGNDCLIGGGGTDLLFGGAGNDSFCFDSGTAIIRAGSAVDRIADFAMGDSVVIDGHEIALGGTAIAHKTVLGATFDKALAAASVMTASGSDMVAIHGTKDSWLFWDGNHDGAVDSAVMLAGIAATSTIWSPTLAAIGHG